MCTRAGRWKERRQCYTETLSKTIDQSIYLSVGLISHQWWIWLYNLKYYFNNYWKEIGSPGRVPRDAAAAELAGDLMLQRPLAQVHHIRSLVDPHHSVCWAGGQHQAHVFGGKLHVSHWGATVHQGGSLDLKMEAVGQTVPNWPTDTHSQLCSATKLTIVRAQMIV